MGYLLRMSDEIRDWLADLHETDPVAGRQVGAALTALLGEGPSLAPPLVVLLDQPPWSYSSTDDLPEALDSSYQERLEGLQALRAHVAEAARLARDIRQQVTELDAQVAALGDQRWRALQDGRPEAAAAAADELGTAQAKLAELKELLPGVIEAEQQLDRKIQREQTWVDTFRTRKETLKANYQAARAQREIHDALADWGAHAGERALASDAEAGATLGQVIAEMERELHPRVSAEGLMELRPGAPGDSDIRILFAVEPPGTALLIAVLEGRDAVQEQRGEAVQLSAEVLQRARAGEAPEAVTQAFDDAPSFLDAFFPGSADEVEAAAAALTARNRVLTLAHQRERLGLTQREVAERMGVRPERVAAIERAEPGAAEIRTLARYIEALGGRLEIIADFGEERVVLR